MATNRFIDKIVVITGGNSGIGRAAALAFAREGAKVVLSARRDVQGNEVVREIKSTGGEALFIKTDVTNPHEVESFINTTIEKYGRIDCAFNNAGVEGTIARLANTTIDQYNYVINANLKGVWLSMKYEILQMRKQECGVIVNNSSIAGLMGLLGASLYCASKHGVLGLTKSAALENTHFNIRINAVCPGFIHTPMVEGTWSQNPDTKNMMLETNAIKRLGKPEEIAAAVLWLCSDEASFMTGREMVLAGGQSI